MRTVVVSEHPGLWAWAQDEGLAGPDAVSLSRVTDPQQILGARVIGDIPLALAALADHVVSVVIDAPKGKRLSAADIHRYVRGYTTVAVVQISADNPYRREVFA